MRKIILASSSPRRIQFFKYLFKDNFIIDPSNYEENNDLNLAPVELAKKHALMKARDVAKKYNSGIIVGVDSLVTVNNEVLGKPGSADKAFEMLRKLSGKENTIISGVAIIDIDNNKEYRDYEITKTKMMKLSDEEIWAYVNSGEPLDRAGAFAIQEGASIFFEKVEGCFSNAFGMPMHKIYLIFKKIGISVFN